MKSVTACSPGRLVRSLGLVVILLALFSGGGLAAKGQDPAPRGEPKLKMTCALPSSSVFPGDPVIVTGSVEGFTKERAKESLEFKWTGDAEVTGDGDTATVTSQRPGTIKIHGKVSLKSDPRQFGECDATMVVRPFDPPTVSCSSNPTTIVVGDVSTVSATATSPQNRPLTYKYASSDGTILGQGAVATFSPGLAHRGRVTIFCNVVDDQGNSASSSTVVDVYAPQAAPAPPPPPSPSGLPPFPWPPPQASARVTLGRKPVGIRSLMRDVDDGILSALDQMGYVERAHYWVPGGFALVTRVEQIYKDGRPKPMPYRFSDELPPPDSLTDYFAGLFTSPPGYFRIIVFVVTNVSFNDTAVPLGKDYAMNLLENGPARLPVQVAHMDVPNGTEYTALIYEYQKSSADRRSPAIPIHSTVDAKTHLQRAGLWKLLGQH